MNVATILQCKKCGKSRTPPIVLHCCHTVCKQCLETDTQPIAPVSDVVCPVCQQKTQTCREHEDLYSNLNTCMRTVSEVLGSRVTEGETDCCVCRLQNVVRPTTHQCLNCGDTLCDACGQGHQSSSATYSHTIVSIGEIRKGKYKVSVQKSFPCKDDKHDGKKYEFYCDTCNQPLCAMCLVLNHVGHQVIPLAEASTRCRSKLQEMSQKMEEKLNGQVKSTRDILIRHRMTIEKTQEATVSAVRGKTQALIDFILKQEQTLVGKITELTNQQRREINLQEKNLEQALEMGAKAVVLSKGALEEGGDEECVLMFQDLCKCLESTSLEKSEGKVAKYTSALKSPVYTIQYNFPEPSSMFSVTETLLEPRVSAALKPDPKPKASPQPVKYSTCGDFHTSEQTLSSQMKKSCTAAKVSDASTIATDDPKRDTVTHRFSPTLPDPVKENADDVYRVTESLSIVGEFGRSLSLNDDCVSESSSKDEQNTVPTTRDYVVPGPLDCNVYPPYQLTSHLSPREVLDKTESKSMADLSALTSILTKRDKSLCLVQKAPVGLCVSKKDTDPVFVGMCRTQDNKLILLDEANKKVRLVHESGRQDSSNHPNQVIEKLSPNGVVSFGTGTVYISGTTVYITDAKLGLEQKFKLDLIDIEKNIPRLPLCRYTDTSFIIGNLPGNKCRVYSTNGNLIQEKGAPVDGPIVAISCTNDSHLLYSSWSQQGAVHQVGSSGQKVQTYRPTGVTSWYPEGTCVDMKNNVYVADPRNGKIYVFRSNGSQLYVHTVTGLSSPRCLLMMPNSTLVVSGEGPCLHPYRCTYSTMM